MRRLLTVVLLLFSLSMFMTACGGSGGNTPAAPSRSINVTLRDFYFVPHSFTVPAGELIALTAVNEGTHAHSFRDYAER